MPRERKYSVSINEKDKDLVEMLSKRYKLPMSEITGYLYEVCNKYDLMVEGWQDRIKVEDEKREARANDCDRFVKDGKGYVCITARIDKPVKKDKLSKDLNTSLEMCEVCKRHTREVEDEKRRRQKEIDAFLNRPRSRSQGPEYDLKRP